MTVKIKIVMRAKEVKDNNFFASVKKFMRQEHTSLTSFTSFSATKTCSNNIPRMSLRSTLGYVLIALAGRLFQ